MKATSLPQSLVALGDTKYLRFSVGPAEDEPIIFLTSAQWDSFLQSVRRDGLSASDPGQTGLEVLIQTDGGMTLTAVAEGTTLVFDRDETEAFLCGVRGGEMVSSRLAAQTGAGRQR